MLYLSPVYSQASGSIAGVTYSHNRGGLYTRARKTPTDPNSTRQQAVRVQMGVLAPAWAGMTAAQRAAWNEYGANVAMTNKLGQSVYLTGQQHFVRSNVPRLQAGVAMILAAPVIFDLGTFTPPTIASASDTPELTIGYTNTDDWAIAVGGYMLVYQGAPQGAGRSFFRGPFRYAGKEAGAVVPPTSPFDATPQFTMTAGQLQWVQVRFIQTDGRLSLPVVLGPEAIATP